MSRFLFLKSPACDFINTMLRVKAVLNLLVVMQSSTKKNTQGRDMRLFINLIEVTSVDRSRRDVISSLIMRDLTGYPVSPLISIEKNNGFHQGRNI